MSNLYKDKLKLALAQRMISLADSSTSCSDKLKSVDEFIDSTNLTYENRINLLLCDVDKLFAIFVESIQGTDDTINAYDLYYYDSNFFKTLKTGNLLSYLLLISSLKDYVSEFNIFLYGTSPYEFYIHNMDEINKKNIKNVKKYQMECYEKYSSFDDIDSEAFDILYGYINSNPDIIVNLFEEFAVFLQFYIGYRDILNENSIEDSNVLALISLGSKAAFEKFGVNAIANRILSYRNKLADTVSKEAKAAMKRLDSYSKLIDVLIDGNKGEEIYDIDDIIKLIPHNDHEMLRAVLEYIYANNLDCYDALSKKYEESLTDRSIDYKIALQRCGLSEKDYDISTVINRPLSEIISIVDIISEFKLKNLDTVLSIINGCSLQDVQRLKKLVDKKVLSAKSLDSYSINSSMIDVAEENIKLFKEKGFNPRFLENNSNILFTASDIVDKNLAILNMYGLKSSLNGSVDLGFLGFDNLDNLIDQVLELGFESVLEKDLNILNFGDRWKRLALYKVNKIPVTSFDEAYDILSSSTFMVSDEKIDEYLPSRFMISDNSNIETNDVRTLEGFSISDRVYSFDGVLVSKKKISRNGDIDFNNDTDLSILIGIALSGTYFSLDEEQVVSKVINSINTVK